MNNNTYTKFESAPAVIGVPGVDGKSSSILQGEDDTCAIRSQELVLRDFGVNVSEEELQEQAINHGWYTPGKGTSSADVGNLLELHGVEVNRYENANIFTLTSELAKGHKVIIGVDSGELWNPENEEYEDDRADHALIVSGIDTSDPDNVKVIITDPGSGDVAKEYPMEQFIDAWKDSNFDMVSTTEPAPIAFNPEMVNFDYALGHIPEIGNLSYDNFQESFAPCMELELSDSLLNDQTELLTKYVDEGGFVSDIPNLTTDETISSNDSESLDTLEDVSGVEDSLFHKHDSSEEEDCDLDDGDDFEDDLY
ncbi:MAG: C39 family peptidase [Rivularia sp. (in: cyanobacteria)]